MALAVHKNVNDSCPVCYTNFEEGKVEDVAIKCNIVVCETCNCSQVCSECWKEYLTMFVNKSKFIVNAPKCFLCNGHLRTKVWKSLVDKDCFDMYMGNLKRSLNMRCSNCDVTSSFLVDCVSYEKRMEAKAKLIEAFKNEPEYLTELSNSLKQFSLGLIDCTGLFDLLNEKKSILENIFVNPDVEYYVSCEWDNFPMIAFYIEDRERRASLIKKFLTKGNGEVSTICCGNRQCFLCHRGSHPGYSCAEYDNNGYNSYGEYTEVEFKSCPSCNLTLEKTEGCSSVRCFCDEEFCWDDASTVFAI